MIRPFHRMEIKLPSDSRTIAIVAGPAFTPHLSVVRNLFNLRTTLNDCCPVWSPDGRTVGFARTEPQAHEPVHVVRTGRHASQDLLDSENLQRVSWRPPDFSWSPDGQSLLVSIVPAASASEPEGRPSIALVSLADSSTRLVTSPPPQFSDWSPAFSPDGRLIAFLRSSGPGRVDDLYVVSATGGEPKRLTFDRRNIDGAPAWTPIAATSSFLPLGAVPPAYGGSPHPVAERLPASKAPVLPFSRRLWPSKASGSPTSTRLAR